MVRKYAAFWSLCIAYAITLAHNFVPHHHHDHHHHLTDDQFEVHHIHQSSDESGLDLHHLFAHFLHSSEGISFLPSVSSAGTENPVVLVTTILNADVHIPALDIPPLQHLKPPEFIACPATVLSTAGLRAPPAFFVLAV